MLFGERNLSFRKAFDSSFLVTGATVDATGRGKVKRGKGSLPTCIPESLAGGSIGSIVGI